MRVTFNSKWTPVICGLASFGLVCWMWGSLDQVATVHDDAAYILQARIFASGHLVAPPRPVPEFFEQYHTFVEPVVAAKYPPGFSLLMVPGIWLGLAGLVPAMLVGLSTSLAFILARKLVNAPVAVLTAVLMNTSSVALRFNPSYSSEIAAGFLILLAWFALYEHWQTGRAKWLMLLAGAVGLGAITRPLTMLAFALPTSFAAIIGIRRHAAWRAIAPCLLIVLAPIAFMFVFNARVTGNWKLSPHGEYARLYIPEDHMGFGSRGAVPARALSDEQQAFNKWVDSLHESHTVENLPATARLRAKILIRRVWTHERVGELAAVVGLFALTPGIAVMLSLTVIGVFAAYLLYAYDPAWVLYYLELQTVLAFLTAVGLFQLARLFARFVVPLLKRRISRRGLEPSALPVGETTRAVWAWSAFALVAAWLLFPVPQLASTTRRAALAKAAYWVSFRQFVSSLPTRRAVVFVRYGRGHLAHSSLVQNEPFGTADVWIVHDRGADNARLMSVADGRVPYLYSETYVGSKVTGRITPLASTAVANQRADSTARAASTAMK